MNTQKKIEKGITEISLLDITYRYHNRDGDIEFNFFKKAARKDNFVHSRSAIPAKCKINAIRNERKRIKERCTVEISERQKQEEFSKTLKRMGYKDKDTRRTRFGMIDNRQQQTDETTRYHYLKIPFINEKINKKMKQIFAQNSINVRLCQKSTTMETALKSKRQNNQKNTNRCKTIHCRLKTEECMTSNVVYSITCSCGSTYIGSTRRPLHTRYTEHLTRRTSAVYQHREHCQGEIKCKVINKAANVMELRVKESIEIQRYRPNLNRKEEMTETLIVDCI